MFNLIKLYTYWRSSCSYRVRIALNLKGLSYESVPIHLVKDGGQQFSENYHKLNPQNLVPTLVDGDTVLSQSIAIMEYLDEAYPESHSLLGSDTVERAQIRALSLLIATDIQPLDNLRVLKYLKGPIQLSDDQKNEWYAHWIIQGFNAYEALLSADDEFSIGDCPTMADACLVPQVYNANRFAMDLSAYPNILKVNENCLKLEAFDRARPENQEDAV